MLFGFGSNIEGHLMSVSRSLPLRLLIIMPFVCLAVLATGIFTFVSYQNSQSIALSVGSSFSKELSKRIEQYVKTVTSIMPAIVDNNADALQQNNLSTDNPDQNTPWLLNQLRQFHQLSFVSLAYLDGRYIAATRPPATPNSIEIASNIFNEQQNLVGYTPNASGHRGKIASTIMTQYDPRNRPFVQCALRTPDLPCWGPVYRYLNRPSYALSLSKAVRNKEGQIVAVTAADISLERLTDFMEQLKIGHEGQAVLTEENGRLIATSDATLIPILDKNNERYSLSSHPAALMRAIARAQNGDSHSETIEVANKTYLIEVRDINLGYNKYWKLIVFLPLSKIANPIMAQVNDMVFINIIALLLLIVLATAIARQIARPIENIANMASTRALNQLAQTPFATSIVTEVQHLSSSLAQLAAAQIRSLKNLERRVQQRTLELQRANARLTTLSEQDPLTGIANRRVFDLQLDTQWRVAHREQHPISVILCDVDHFKSYNDFHGHQAGDKALQQIASLLQGQIQRPTDLAARYGGEEFALILPNTDMQGAWQFAEKLRQATEELALPRQDMPNQQHITLSLGFATLVPGVMDQPDTLVRLADEQLYVAKANGRNQVQPEPELTEKSVAES